MQHLIIADTSKEFIQRIIDLFENRIDTDKIILMARIILGRILFGRLSPRELKMNIKILLRIVN